MGNGCPVCDRTPCPGAHGNRDTANANPDAGSNTQRHSIAFQPAVECSNADAGPNSGTDAGTNSGTDAGPDAGTNSGTDAGPVTNATNVSPGPNNNDRTDRHCYA
ncbi:hypothetical protein NHF46_19285 [Arthrobacter alpinus]|nr:hypothetical protein [Arthrobacter alpinus]